MEQRLSVVSGMAVGCNDDWAGGEGKVITDKVTWLEQGPGGDK